MIYSAGMCGRTDACFVFLSDANVRTVSRIVQLQTFDLKNAFGRTNNEKKKKKPSRPVSAPRGIDVLENPWIYDRIGLIVVGIN